MMKKLLILIYSGLLLASACTKNDNDTPPVVPKATLTCKVDGVNFVADTVIIYQVNSGGINKIGCEAFDALGNKISFAVDASTTGTYPLTGSQSGVNMLDLAYEPVGEPTFFVFGSTDTATIVFSSVKDYNLPTMSISGTFSYSVTRTPNTKLITQGEFANVIL